MRTSGERPQHEVTVSAFAISPYLITRQLYREWMADTPSQWQRDEVDERLPANYVSWFDAIRYYNALSKAAGLTPCYRINGEQVAWCTSADGYRLPTEAEWEYASRAGTASKWFCGDDEAVLERYAWFAENSKSQAHPMGEKAPNPWGLYDIAGNVYEWCWDRFGNYRDRPETDPIGPDHGDGRMLRGGSAWDIPWFLRSARREWGDAHEPGRRCQLSLRPSPAPPALIPCLLDSLISLSLSHSRAAPANFLRCHSYNQHCHFPGKVVVILRLFPRRHRTSDTNSS